jgi:hypothetical protein
VAENGQKLRSRNVAPGYGSRPRTLRRTRITRHAGREPGRAELRHVH